MIHEVILPKLGTNIEDGKIVEWRSREGDRIKKGDVLLLVETSKAIFEVESEADGFLRKIFRKAGDEAKFTEPVAILSEALHDDIDTHVKKVSAPRKKEKRYHEQKREELFNSTVKKQNEPHRKQVAATPAAKRLCSELKLDIAEISAASGADIVDEKVVKEFLNRKKVAIYGAGLGAKQAKELLKFYGSYELIGLFDDNRAVKDKEMLGLKVLGSWMDFLEFASKGEVDSIVISLHSEYRRKLIEKIQSAAPFIELMPLVDKRAIVSDGVTISSGAFVEAGSILGPDTFVGSGVIIDTGAVVSHDCHIGDHSHLSPGCSLSGIVRLEGNVLVGVGASINSQVTIGKNVVITPGSAVMCDFPDDVVVSGNPAKIIGKSFRGI
ncbi:MAG: NeuD/PglB/VioB family sugar acetyltransferase [Deltaproteobacteria bacterium]|nr:NeuD/PglB/VioB family sugar acetyltransferase [Deltaproteobacteria bacterium]